MSVEIVYSSSRVVKIPQHKKLSNFSTPLSLRSKNKDYFNRNYSMIMGFFTTDPKITEEEMRQIRSKLISRGFTARELDDVEKVFRGDMESASANERGISKKELEDALKFMRENTSKHSIPSHKIDILEEEMRKKI
ncbi:MAG: hypothetical protein A2934_01030 [Candidatus Sungbacteria bacterium RIFCSPLOWO2_01_FULL_47_10]|uniref:Uncharacterized protein n=1 Tax=Candidatus Sungbacteria bacterium RIFCSPLOWO2_01_FULL_47_10 TaxID=1802276 RepID=A0A1G2L4P2_9BACT|nr:MAG: hypothetical protein A2934_01030 [Candidatus Sungbacteria bacterium RIFCSPLOWO2_01_FULL_47_10]